MIDNTVIDREENIRTPINRMIEDWKTFIEELKNDLRKKVEKLKLVSISEIKTQMKQLVEIDNSQQKQKEMKEQIDHSNQIEEIKIQLERICDRLKDSD